MSIKPHIMICTPCFGDMVSKGYMTSFIELISNKLSSRFSIAYSMIGGDSLITRSRNKLVADFMRAPWATHLMFIDADISFQPNDVYRLIEFNEDVVAGSYPIKAIDWTKVYAENQKANSIEDIREAGLHFVGIKSKGDNVLSRDGFISADYAGTGFMLISRQCLERLIAAYPETEFMDDHCHFDEMIAPTKKYALFDCMIDPETKTYLSEDYTFCRRWRDIGGKVWIDTTSRLKHHGAYTYQGTPKI